MQEFNFEVEGAAREVALRTWSFAGGTNAEGQVIKNGGFDPVVSLFNSSTGARDSFNDDSGLVMDPLSGAAWDSFLATNLSALRSGLRSGRLLAGRQSINCEARWRFDGFAGRDDAWCLH